MEKTYHTVSIYEKCYHNDLMHFAAHLDCMELQVKRFFFRAKCMIRSLM